jgi:hypothetical protein
MKYTFSKSTIKRIILEELKKSEIEDAAEEITDEIESLLQEGNEEALDKVYDKIAKKSTDKKIDLKQLAQQTYKKMAVRPSLKRLLVGLSMGAFIGMAQQVAFDYSEMTSSASAQAQKISSAQLAGLEASKEISSFTQIAAAEAGAAPVSTQKDVDKALDNIRIDYAQDFQKAPIAPGRGIFIDGNPTKGGVSGFVYVPASEISDDTVLPFAGITKGDYEKLLRATFLGSAGGDQRLKELVTGQGKKGSSGFWSYDNETLFSSVADLGREDERGKEIAQLFYNLNPAYNNYAMLPLEWSVAYDLLQKRQGAGRQ